MSIFKAKYSDIPSDAVVVSRKEALEFQFQLIKNWKNSSDVFAFKNGGIILASASSLVGIYVNSHYRRKMKLHSYGRMSSYIPIVVIPAILSFILHTEMVLPNLLLLDGCPTCLQLRASAIQSFTAVALPLVLGPLSSYSLAMGYATYNMPYITSEPLKVFKLYKSQTKPIVNLMFACFIGQALLGSVVTYFEGRSVITVNEKLAKVESELELKEFLA